MAPIRDSLSFKRFIAICAFFFPLIFRPVSRLLVLAVKAVSDPEKNADSIKRINIDKNTCDQIINHFAMMGLKMYLPQSLKKIPPKKFIA